MGIVIELSKRQKQCRHNALRIRVSDEVYHKFGSRKHKVEIICADCEVCIARAGEVWVNRRMAILGIIDEHWPKLLLEEGMKI